MKFHEPKPLCYIPLGDKLIVDVDKADTEKNGIKIPEGSQERPNTGLVVAVGPGTTVGMSSEVRSLAHLLNKRVLLMRHAGLPIMHAGKEHVIVKEHEVLAVEA